MMNSFTTPIQGSDNVNRDKKKANPNVVRKRLNFGQKTTDKSEKKKTNHFLSPTKASELKKVAQVGKTKFRSDQDGATDILEKTNLKKITLDIWKTKTEIKKLEKLIGNKLVNDKKFALSKPDAEKKLDALRKKLVHLQKLNMQADTTLENSPFHRNSRNHIPSISKRVAQTEEITAELEKHAKGNGNFQNLRLNGQLELFAHQYGTIALEKKFNEIKKEETEKKEKPKEEIHPKKTRENLWVDEDEIKSRPDKNLDDESLELSSDSESDDFHFKIKNKKKKHSPLSSVSPINDSDYDSDGGILFEEIPDTKKTIGINKSTQTKPKVEKPKIIYRTRYISHNHPSDDLFKHPFRKKPAADDFSNLDLAEFFRNKPKRQVINQVPVVDIFQKHRDLVNKTKQSARLRRANFSASEISFTENNSMHHHGKCTCYAD